MKFEIKRSVTYIMLHHRKRTVMQCGGTCQQTERVLTIQVSHVSLSQLLSCRRSEGSAPYVLLSTREKVVCGGVQPSPRRLKPARERSSGAGAKKSCKKYRQSRTKTDSDLSRCRNFAVAFEMHCQSKVGRGLEKPRHFLPE